MAIDSWLRAQQTTLYGLALALACTVQQACAADQRDDLFGGFKDMTNAPPISSDSRRTDSAARATEQAGAYATDMVWRRTDR